MLNDVIVNCSIVRVDGNPEHQVRVLQSRQPRRERQPRKNPPVREHVELRFRESVADGFDDGEKPVAEESRLAPRYRQPFGGFADEPD